MVMFLPSTSNALIRLVKAPVLTYYFSLVSRDPRAQLRFHLLSTALRSLPQMEPHRLSLAGKARWLQEEMFLLPAFSCRSHCQATSAGVCSGAWLVAAKRLVRTHVFRAPSVKLCLQRWPQASASWWWRKNSRPWLTSPAKASRAAARPRHASSWLICSQPLQLLLSVILLGS